MLLAGTAAGLLASCGASRNSNRDQGSPNAEPTQSDWRFTDDRGVAVSLPKPPERVVAYIGTAAVLWAAVLWDFGYAPSGCSARSGRTMGQRSRQPGAIVAASGTQPS